MANLANEVGATIDQAGGTAVNGRSGQQGEQSGGSSKGISQRIFFSFDFTAQCSLTGLKLLEIKASLNLFFFLFSLIFSCLPVKSTRRARKAPLALR